jgi:hypothetical protein
MIGTAILEAAGKAPFSESGQHFSVITSTSHIPHRCSFVSHHRQISIFTPEHFHKIRFSGLESACSADKRETESGFSVQAFVTTHVHIAFRKEKPPDKHRRETESGYRYRHSRHVQIASQSKTWSKYDLIDESGRIDINIKAYNFPKSMASSHWIHSISASTEQSISH